MKDSSKKNLPTADEMVSGIVRLVSLPEVCIRVNEMLEDPDVTVREIGQVIGQDTGLTARLLKIVNSSFYGFSSRIETVSRAVTVIGLRELRGLVLAASAIETFSRIPTEILNMVRFWRHSVYCGVVAKLLAERCHVLHSERLFVAGLLHDIGKLVIYNRLPDESRQVVDLAYDEKMLDYQAEQKIFGFDHSEIGGKLLASWQMPVSLCEAVQYHHEPLSCQDSLMEACIIHIANAMTGMAEQGLDADQQNMIQSILPQAWEVLRLDESVIESVLLEAGPLFTNALESILPRPGYSR